MLKLIKIILMLNFLWVTVNCSAQDQNSDLANATLLLVKTIEPILNDHMDVIDHKSDVTSKLISSSQYLSLAIVSASALSTVKKKEDWEPSYICSVERVLESLRNYVSKFSLDRGDKFAVQQLKINSYEISYLEALLKKFKKEPGYNKCPNNNKLRELKDKVQQFSNNKQ